MYNLIIWDKVRAATGQEGSLSKLEIPIDFAKFLFQQDSIKFPGLSSLSFDDYDLFSGAEIELLAQELIDFGRVSPQYSENINAMMSVISKAQSLGKDILFDPFRNE